MQLIDGLAQRWGQHPSAILNGDSYAFRLINTLDAFGLLSHRTEPKFETFDEDPTGLGAMTETLGG